jgi:hypothetical protein
MSISRTISNLVNGQAYLVRVRAVNPTTVPNLVSPWATATSSTLPRPDASYINDYIRQLTGVFSRDIITDDLILFWINEAYSELARLYEWPWLPITPLAANQAPKFDADFATILAYRVAPRVLELEADDGPRAAAYTKEYERMLENMYKSLLRTQDITTPATMADLVLHVRTLLDEYSTRLDTAMIQTLITNTHDELVIKEAWVFPSGSFPRMGWADARILAYGAAARLAPMVDKSADFTNVLLQEYSTMLDHLRLKFENDFSTRGNTADDLIRQSRTFLGVYSKKASDSLLKTWLYEEYQNLCSERPWAWLEKTNTYDIAANATSFNFGAGAGRVKIHEMNRIQLDGAGRIIESEPLILAPSLIGIPLNTDNTYYVYDTSTKTVHVGPTRDDAYKIRVRYEELPDVNQAMTSNILVPDRFVHILAYRVAMRAAVIVEAPQAVFDLCQKAAEALYNAMYNDYQMAHTNEAFQLGGSSLEDRKYVPWFRA